MARDKDDYEILPGIETLKKDECGTKEYSFNVNKTIVYIMKFSTYWACIH